MKKYFVLVLTVITLMGSIVMLPACGSSSSYDGGSSSSYDDWDTDDNGSADWQDVDTDDDGEVSSDEMTDYLDDWADEMDE